MTTSSNAAGTRQYFTEHRIHADKLRTLDGLSVSAIAVGTYLGDSNDATDRLYEEALVHAAQNGVNFFDTAINYRCQRSERAIAYALRKLAGMGVPREAVFVSTKGGFLPADGNPAGFQEYVYQCFLNTGLITPEDIVGNCHCMTPAYLKSQIGMSLANLKVDAIDLYYLHNPEMQLPVVGEKIFYANLTKVFELFESEVAAGRIKRYGLATWNGFRQSPGAPDLLNLEKILAAAKTAGGSDHHFRAIQLPYSLAMMEAVAIPNQKAGSEDFPAIAAAAYHGISVMVSAPLLQAQIARLPAGIIKDLPGEGTVIQKALQFVTSSPGVVSAMVGMKNIRHVDENREVLRQKNWSVEDLQKTAQIVVR